MKATSNEQPSMASGTPHLVGLSSAAEAAAGPVSSADIAAAAPELRALNDRRILGGVEKLRVDLERMHARGIIDEEGNILRKDILDNLVLDDTCV